MSVRDLRATQWFWCDNKVHDLYSQKIGVLAYAVYTSLCRYANQNGQCWPAANTVATSLGISDRTFFRCIKKLISYDLVTVQSGGLNGGSNVYVIKDVPLDPQSYPMTHSHTPHDSQSYPPLTDSHTNNTYNNNTTTSVKTKTPNKVLKQSEAVTAKAPKESSCEAHVSSPHKEVVAYFVNSYQAKTGCKYTFLPKDASIIANLLKATDKTDIMKRIDALFASNDPFFKTAGYTTGVLSACFNKLNIVSKPVAGGASGREL